MAVHNGMYFTTKDSDNDLWHNNCAMDNWSSIQSGGWWYKRCAFLLLNTLYNDRHGFVPNRRWHSLPFTEIKIRPNNCTHKHSQNVLLAKHQYTGVCSADQSVTTKHFTTLCMCACVSVLYCTISVYTYQ